MEKKLAGKTLFITGASRGIGRSIALRAAQDGANIVVIAKTVEPHPTLEGTIYTVAAEIEALGGKALPIAVDVRDENQIRAAVEQAASHFGGIDILVNNASAINLMPTAHTSMKRFDLMMGVNVRATYACTQACLPYLAQAENPHVLTMSPPLNMKKKWFKDHVAYTISKYGMSMCTLGFAAEFAEMGIAVNSLWPKTTIATAAIAVHFPEAIYQASRTPEIVADAAYLIFTQDSRTLTGQFLIDEEVLRQHGVEDFTSYAVNPQAPLFYDLYID